MMAQSPGDAELKESLNDETPADETEQLGTVVISTDEQKSALIEAVRQFPAIWNARGNSYSNNTKRNNAWKSVSKLTNFESKHS